MNLSPEDWWGGRTGLKTGLGKSVSLLFQEVLELISPSGARGPQLQALWESDGVCATPGGAAVPPLPYVTQAEGMASNHRKSKSSLQTDVIQGPTRKTDYSGHFKQRQWKAGNWLYWWRKSWEANRGDMTTQSWASSLRLKGQSREGVYQHPGHRATRMGREWVTD